MSRSNRRVSCLTLGLVAVASCMHLGCRNETDPTTVDLAVPVESSESTTTANTAPANPTLPKTTSPNTTSPKTTTVAEAPPVFVNAHFEAPFRLMVENEPLNNTAKQIYPSPAMFDVDNDGQIELVTGDLRGSIKVYENQNADEGDPVWSKHYALMSSDDKPIKVSNW